MKAWSRDRNLSILERRSTNTTSWSMKTSWASGLSLGGYSFHATPSGFGATLDGSCGNV